MTTNATRLIWEDLGQWPIFSDIDSSEWRLLTVSSVGYSDGKDAIAVAVDIVERTVSTGEIGVFAVSRVGKPDNSLQKHSLKSFEVWDHLSRSGFDISQLSNLKSLRHGNDMTGYQSVGSAVFDGALVSLLEDSWNYSIVCTAGTDENVDDFLGTFDFSVPTQFLKMEIVKNLIAEGPAAGLIIVTEINERSPIVEIYYHSSLSAKIASVYRQGGRDD